MPTTAFPEDQCVVDRRRRGRRFSDRTRPKSKIAVDEAGDIASEKPAKVSATKVEQRKVERRRQIDPTTCERDYGGDEIEFMTAMDDYKRRSGRMFPTWSEVLEVLRDLGYRKVAEQTQTYTGEE